RRRLVVQSLLHRALLRVQTPYGLQRARDLAEARGARERAYPVSAPGEPKPPARGGLPRGRGVLQVVQLRRLRRGEVMVALGNFFFRFRTTISPFLLLLLLIPGAAVFDDPLVAAVIGLAIAAVGQVIRATTIGFEYIVRGGRNHRVYADGLVTKGLFQHTRNPMYVGKFLMVLGVGFASNRWPSLLAITLAYSFMYQCVTLAEEAYLRNKFGPAFDEYCRRVPRWLPRLSGLGETLSGSEFRWRRVLVKGYSEPLGWTLPIVAIGLYNLHELGPLDEQPGATGVLLGALGIAVLFAAVMGWLKKSRSPVLSLNDT